MKVNYALYANHVPVENSGYRALVRSAGTANLEMIVARMMLLGSTVSEPDALAVLEGKKKPRAEAPRRGGKRKTLRLRVLARGKRENKKVKCAFQQLFRAPNAFSLLSPLTDSSTMFIRGQL